MPWIKISKEAHTDMKQLLVDIDDLSLGDLVEACFEFSMENLENFEKFLGLEDMEQDQVDEEQEEVKSQE